MNYYWDHESMYGETIECGRMICEREMSSAGGGKEGDDWMSNGREFQRTDAATGNERRLTVDRRKDGTRSDCDDDDVVGDAPAGL